MNKIREVVKRIPVVNDIANKIIVKSKNLLFKESGEYWENRYAEGGNSGPGSYDALAIFKADQINTFLREKGVRSAIEFGCGDGSQLEMINYHSYIGLDVSKTAISLCKKRFSQDKSKSFFLYSSACFVDNGSIFVSELSISLDTIYHLVEDEIYENYMSHLFSSASKYVIIYSSNVADNLRNNYAHIKHREFTKTVEEKFFDWCLLKFVPNKYPYSKDSSFGSFANFYIFEKNNKHITET